MKVLLGGVVIAAFCALAVRCFGIGWSPTDVYLCVDFQNTSCQAEFGDMPGGPVGVGVNCQGGCTFEEDPDGHFCVSHDSNSWLTIQEAWWNAVYEKIVPIGDYPATGLESELLATRPCKVKVSCDGCEFIELFMAWVCMEKREVFDIVRGTPKLDNSGFPIICYGFE